MVYSTSCTVHVDEQVHSHNYDSLYFLSTGIVPFSETNFQDFSKIQIDSSRTLVFTLTLLLPNHKVRYTYTAIHFIFFTWVQQIFRTFKYQKPFSRTFQSWKMLLKMYPVSIPGIYKPLGDCVYQDNTRGQVGYPIVHVLIPWEHNTTILYHTIENSKSMGHTRHADGRVGCISINYKTVFLYSDWLYFLWHGTCTCISWSANLAWSQQICKVH